VADRAPGYRLFATIPPPAGPGASPDGTQVPYVEAVRRTGRLAEAAGFTGALVYSDNNTVDPWVVTHELLAATRDFVPLVAVQPLFAHPYALAKRIAAHAALHGRRVALNLVAGGAVGDLAALGDTAAHDERYARLTEYAQVVVRLLAGRGPVTYEGRHYRVRALPLVPPAPPDCVPELFVSGSSPAGRAAAEALGALPVSYPDPREGDPAALKGGGIRIGVIARDTAEEAWRAARARFPDSRAGRLTQRAARTASDSHWVARLSSAEEFPAGPDGPYWMRPFLTHATFCPYLVGTHARVAAEIARYLDAGVTTFVLDTARADSDHAAAAALFARAAAR
jgi:alkanesulfonate monooxygenase